MFKTILIANRGEIACRIIRTARSMGIRTVAIYSAADQNSLHVQQADCAYYVGEAAAKDSYLNIDQIIKVAQLSQAEAIHPGYGFLSENPKFAAACAAANIVFIGPSISAMEAMASKQLAKQLLEKTTVPLTPGYHGLEQSEAHLLGQAEKIGFPVLLKAANGGGGKGMRAVADKTEFADALASAQREAQASFADRTMIIEKLVQNPRHVEIQIMADNHGHVVHLFERDCSIQRRHQKIIEEAPAPNLSPSLRQKLAQAACEVARSIKYLGAGTVEFLVDGDSHFYFMEMNTRLQVEHPVTELITGLDLVAWQLKIAANEPLPLQQEEIKAQGHAIECRIYAEDPYKDFVPSIGQIKFIQEPCGDGIRIDTGVKLNSEITMYYDPMIAKLITWGENREAALQRMQQALAHYYLTGLKTNIPFLQAICQHPKFQNAQLSTDFLNTETITLPQPDKNLAVLMAVSFDYLKTTQQNQDPVEQATFGWQIQGTRSWTWHYFCDDKKIKTQILAVDQHEFEMYVDDAPTAYRISCRLDANLLTLQISSMGVVLKATVEEDDNALTVYLPPAPCRLERFSWSNAHAASSTHKNQLTAPMPATVVAILKNKGDKVRAGDRLIVLEAMKMEHTISAPQDGILTELFFPVGAQVQEGAQLLALGEAT